MYDILIRNALVVDGSGAPGYVGDVAVKSGKLVTNPTSGEAKHVIDATGLVLSPGFIDAHCHEDETLGNRASVLSKISQGITTVSAGQCGESVYPISTDPKKADLLKQFLAEYMHAPDCGYKDRLFSFTGLAAFLNYAETRNTAYNYVMYTGHIPLRIAAMGYDNRNRNG